MFYKRSYYTHQHTSFHVRLFWQRATVECYLLAAG